MAAPKGDSRERLMNAAEQLFARKGFTATSIRDIASHSGDTIGTLSYHFGSKDALLSEVVARRFDEMTERRRALYHEMLRASPDGKVNLEDTIRAIVVPFLDAALRSGPVWRDYTTLISRMMYTTDPEKFEEFIARVNPVALEFIGWIQAAAPDVSVGQIAYGYQFMIGCLIDASIMEERDRLAHLTGGAIHSGDVGVLQEKMIVFVVAGLKGLFSSPDSF